MNFGSFLSIVMAGSVLWFGVFAHAADPRIFLDSHALILVFGGTTTAALMAFPLKKLGALIKLFVVDVLLNKRIKNRSLVENLIEAAKVSKSNPAGLSGFKSAHPFLGEGFQLIGDGVLSEHELKEVLRHRANTMKKNYAGDAKMFAALGKFPPAFGLLGAVTGMIAMMGTLGNSSDPAVMGKAMAIALVATFWGIGTANLLFLPLSDYYVKLADEDYAQRCIIVEGLMMVKRRESPLVVTEKLNSFLPIKERIEGMGGGGSSAMAA